ncbi:MAG: hypothetical protein PHG29_07370 [Prolixibacteraceae bacterium]|nr:hypothetical protein [Prolixibacteraceae bacterium]
MCNNIFLSSAGKIFKLMLFAFLSFILPATGQLPPAFSMGKVPEVRETGLTRKYLSPVRIVHAINPSGEMVKNPESILIPGNGQADLNSGKYLTLINGEGDSAAGIILDFGREINGGVEIITTRNNTKPAGRVRIRFGESVAETMSDTEDNGATNDHAMRDFIVTLPWLGKFETGESGFRFVRIDLVGPGAKLEIKEINAIFVYRDIPYTGSFKSNDKRLNDIWMTGAYTVHLNMQEYLWDGIKRDRLVWVGDLHPEVMSVNAVFGKNEVVPKSLDLARNLTPLPGWMNGISSYSMWWVLIHRDWYYFHGDISYLREQKDYLSRLLLHLSAKIDDSGRELLDGSRFLDWPSSENRDAVHAGLQSMMLMTFNAGAELCKILNDRETELLCIESAGKLKKHIPEMGDSKQAAALLALSGLIDPETSNSKVLARGGSKGMSTFYGYYMLQARALAGDYQGALENIREYWGGMLDLGATTFWEDFNIEWMENAARIDEVVPEGKTDVHGEYGDYCYQSYRHSLCHGWASGPTAWLTEHVLGIKVVEPGAAVIRIDPHLGDLEWVEGTYPTPFGVLTVKHQKDSDGKIKTFYDAPKGVQVILN